MSRKNYFGETLPPVKVFEFVNSEDNPFYEIHDLGLFFSPLEDPKIYYSGWSKSKGDLMSKGSCKNIRNSIKDLIKSLPLSRFFLDVEEYRSIYSFNLNETFFSDLIPLNDLDSLYRSNKISFSEYNKTKNFYFLRREILKNVEIAQFEFLNIDETQSVYHDLFVLGNLDYKKVNSGLKIHYSNLEKSLVK